mmetsp:Transcript_85730/g.243130  ORF Transcript_85730/g.243130 Transcript_85730/m.243130 type:complete len:381 (-) Transcript_85730:280-1422(-)
MATKSPFSRFPEEKLLRTWPVRFIRTIVFVRVHTNIIPSSWSPYAGNFGARMAEFTAYCIAEFTCGGGGGVKVLSISVVLASKTMTLLSDEAVMTLPPSRVYTAVFTYEVCPRYSFSVFPDFSPWARAVWSKEAVSSCVESLDQEMWVIPSPCARSYRRAHWPVATRQTFSCPAWQPVARSSDSLEKATAMTAFSCIMKLPSSWYWRSLRSIADWWSQTSMKPSTDPETQYWPSGENCAHSGCDFPPKRTVFAIIVGHCSFSSTALTATPRNTSNCTFLGSRPVCCCHFMAWPTSASSREGGATLTCLLRVSAMVLRRFSLGMPSKASLGSKLLFLTRASSRRNRSGQSCLIAIIGAVSRSRCWAVSTSRSSASSRTICA